MRRRALPILLVLGGLLVAGCLSKGDTQLTAGGPIGKTPCEQYCNHLRTYGCNADGCDEACAASIEEHPSCEGSINGYSSCVVENSITCDAVGDPVIAGCTVERTRKEECLAPFEPAATDEQCAEKATFEACFLCCGDRHPEAANELVDHYKACECAPSACGEAPECAAYCGADAKQDAACASASCMPDDCATPASEACSKSAKCAPVLACKDEQCVGKP